MGLLIILGILLVLSLPTIILVVIIVAIVRSVNKSNNNIGQQQIQKIQSQYQNVDQVHGLQARNTELDTLLNNELNKDDPDVELLKSYKQEINKNNTEISRLIEEDNSRVQQVQAEIVKQSSWNKEYNGGIVLYIGSILLIAGFCGLFAFSDLAALCIHLTAVLIFGIIAAMASSTTNKRVIGIRVASLYVIESIMPFIMGLICSLADISGGTAIAICSLGIFAVYLGFSFIIKSELSAILAVLASSFVAISLPSLIGLNDKFIYIAVSLLIYGVILTSISNIKSLPERYSKPIRVVEGLVVFTNVIAASSFVIFSKAMVAENTLYTLIAVGSLAQMLIASFATGKKFYDICARIVGYFVGTIIVLLLVRIPKTFITEQELAIASAISAIVCMLYSVIVIAINRSKSSDSVLNQETILYSVFGFTAITSVLNLNPTIRVFSAVAITAIFCLGYYLCRQYKSNNVSVYTGRAMEATSYAAAYLLITATNTVIDGLAYSPYDTTIVLLKTTLSVHILAGALILCGNLGKRHGREALGVLALSLTMATVALTDYSDSAVSIYTLIHVIESIAITLIGFLTKDRGWMGAFGIISILFIIVTYTSEFLLLWFVLFGIALVGLAVYLAVRQKK